MPEELKQKPTRKFTEAESLVITAFNDLMEAFMEREDFHRNQANDPHNIHTAIMVAMGESKEACKQVMYRMVDAIKEN